MKDRVGTERDADALTKLFIYLGFYTNRYDDLKGREMRRKLQVKFVTFLKPIIIFLQQKHILTSSSVRTLR